MRRALICWLATLALVGHVALRPVWDSDAGWHLAVGRLVQAGQVPRANLLAFTAAGHPWYATSWLYDLACAALEARLGVLGIQVVALALLALALLFWALALARIDPAGPWLLPAGALALLPRITHRPHLATWAALGAVLLVCLAGRRRPTRARFAAALVVALASNLHAGAAFAAGIAGLFCLEELWRTRRWQELAAAVACGAALFANPGGAADLRYLLLHLRVQSVVELREFLPASPARETCFFVLLPLAIAAVLWRWREAGFALAGSFAALALLGLRSGRVSYDALFPGLLLAALLLAPLRDRLGARVPALVAVLLALGSAAAVDAPQWLLSFRPAARWNPDKLPVRAAAFIAHEKLGGPHFNGLRDGGYLEAALPGQPAFADGRIQAFPESFWRAFQDAERSGPAFRGWLEAQGIEWALTLRDPERLGGYRLMESPQWALVYWDAVNELWVRRSAARHTALIERLEYRHFRPYGSIVGKVSAAPRADLPRFVAEAERYLETSPGDPFALLVECALATRAANPAAPRLCAAAEASGEEAVRALVPKARAVPPAR